MKMLVWAALWLSALFACAIAAPAAATPVPQCTNSGGSYVPCQGVVPADLSGNALDWATLLSGGLGAAIGVIGSPAPTRAMQNGYSDPSGKEAAQGGDANGNAYVSDRILTQALQVSSNQNHADLQALGTTPLATDAHGVAAAAQAHTDAGQIDADLRANLKTYEQGLGYVASAKTAVSATLTAAGTVGPFVPIAHRQFHAFISGTGSGTCEVQSQVDGANWFPFQTTQGTSIYKVNYAGSPVNEGVLVEDQYNLPVRWNCTSVSGSIVPGLSQ